jgi:hypothetical protein
MPSALTGGTDHKPLSTTTSAQHNKRREVIVALLQIQASQLARHTDGQPSVEPNKGAESFTACPKSKPFPSITNDADMVKSAQNQEEAHNFAVDLLIQT